MSDTQPRPASERGRPRSFDVDEAIGAAKAVFCREGYEGATLSTLTQAMGIGPPSFYAAFGSKEGLFLEVLGHYHRAFEARLRTAFGEQDTALHALTAVLDFTARNHCAESPMQGCLVVNSTIYGCRRQKAIARRVAALVQSNEDLIAARLQRGQREGDVGGCVDTRRVACFVNGLLQAMAVTARITQSRDAVLAIPEIGAQALDCLLRGR